MIGNETFEVGVNGATGEVVYWELGIFDFPAHSIDPRVTVSPEEARQRAMEVVRERGLSHAPRAEVPITLVVLGREPYYGMLFAAGGGRDPLYVTVHGRRGQAQIGPQNEEFEEVVETLQPGAATTFPASTD